MARRKTRQRMTRLLWGELEEDLPEVCLSEIIGWLKLMLIEAGQLVEGGGHRASRCGTRTSQRPWKALPPFWWSEVTGGEWGLLAMEKAEQTQCVGWALFFFFCQSVS